MIKITAKADIDRLARLMGSSITKQIPYATALAVTALAWRIKQAEIKVMSSRLHQPTRWTVNGLWAKGAKKSDKPIEGRVWFKDEAGKGTPTSKYMPYSVYGGERRHKRFELALIARGLMQPAQFVVPGSGAQVDSYGNMSRGQIMRVLSGLGAAERTSGYSANATNSSRSRRKGNAQRYFVATIDGAQGVWERVNSGFGDGVKPIMIFTEGAPSYRKRYPFFQVAENTQKKWYYTEFTAALDKALGSAK